MSTGGLTETIIVQSQFLLKSIFILKKVGKIVHVWFNQKLYCLKIYFSDCGLILENSGAKFSEFSTTTK